MGFRFQNNKNQRAKSQGAEIISSEIIVPENVVVIPDKWCYKCREWYPGTLEYFHRDVDKSDGLDNRCKLCGNAQRKKRYAKAKKILDKHFSSNYN